MHIRCPHCQNAIEYLAEKHNADLTCPSCSSLIAMSEGDETLSMSPGSGECIAHFELIDTLGTGGFGSVHSAKDTHLDRLVAIKLPRFDGMADKYLKNFLKEARAAAQIKHPNIVSVHEIGQDGEDGRVYIVSDLINGVSLSERLEQTELPPRKVAGLTKTILQALQAAHDAGVIHRDLKPANILLDHNDEPHITDFGLAKREGAAEMTVTVRGEVLGTPAYMSPEQAAGDGYKADARSDIYSVGVMLYTMLAGRKPFIARESRLLIQQVLRDEPAPPRKHNKDAPTDLQTICLKAMEKDPAKRYKTATEMADDLQRYLDGRPITARPVSAFERTWRWARRNPAIATALATIFVLCGALLASFVFRPDGAPEVHYPLVRIDSVPSGAEVAIVPLDPVGRIPVAEELVLPEGRTPLELELPPGEYLIVARKGKKFHEVVRRVPGDTPMQDSRQYPFMGWVKTDDGTVVLPSIELFDQVRLPGQMARIEGGTFVMGKSKQQGTLPHQRQIESFYLFHEEVSRGQFLDLMPPPSTGGVVPHDTADDAPMTGIKWAMAVEFAEKVGGRLPTEAEFEFAATNGGSTEFPWGNQPDVIETWEYGAVRIAPYDVRPGAVPIYGLYSNVAEWTFNSWHPYPGTGPVAQQVSPEALPEMLNTRSVRGGDRTVADGKPKPEFWATGAREVRTFRPISRTYSHIGFRVARSAKPPFLP